MFLLFLIFAKCPTGSYQVGELNSKFKLDYQIQRGKKNFHQIDQRLLIKEPFIITSSKKALYNSTGLISKFEKQTLIWEIETCPMDSISISKNGDIYFAGTFEKTCKFGNSTISIPKFDSLYQYFFGKFKMNGYFIGKIDLNGNLKWIKPLGYSIKNYDNNIHTIQVENDSILLSGNYFKLFNLKNEKKYESSFKRCFIMRLSLDGDILWSKNVFGVCKKLLLDSRNNMIIGGKIKLRYYKKGNITINGSYSYDTLLMKFKDKKYDWIQIGGSKYGQEEIIDFVIDKNDNIIANGYFIGKSKFDKELIESNTRDIFLIKYNPLGNVTFLKNIGSDILQSNSLIIDTYSSIIFTILKGNEPFLEKYDQNGVKIWSESLPIYKKIDIIENFEMILKDNTLYAITRMNKFNELSNSVGFSDSILLKFNINMTKGSCEQCQKGSYDNGKNECIQCPEGYYQDEVGKSTCKQCKENMNSRVGSSKCVLSCPKGTESLLDKCVECKIGYYSNDGIQCIPCPVGSFNNQTKSHECFTKKEKKDFRILFYSIVIIIVFVFIYYILSLILHVFSSFFVRRSELVELEKRMNEKYEKLLKLIENK